MLLLPVFYLISVLFSCLCQAQDSISADQQKLAFFTLCRNSDLYDMVETIINYTSRIKQIDSYDWVFLNDKPFSTEFIDLITAVVPGTPKFGLIDDKDWSMPSHIDQSIVESNIDKILSDPEGPYPYADSFSYRNMCRYMSGGFQWHPLLLDYTHFWRVEPGVRLYCDTTVPEETKYSFTISMIEYPKTVVTLMDSVIEGLESLNKTHLLSAEADNLSRFVYDSSRGYTMCHFWTNFEIGSLDVLRSETYMDLFRFLDQKGGFYYERWGDAPVRTILLSLLLPPGDITRLHDWAYQHEPYVQCPQSVDKRCALRCSCDPGLDFTDVWFSCASWFDTCKGH